MRFYEIRTPDGWGVPGVHGPWAEDELDGNVQGGSYLVIDGGEALLIDTGNRVPGTDVSMGPTLIGLIERLRERRERTILLVEHKIDMVMALSDSIAVLKDGRLIADGPPATVSASAEVQAAYFGAV